MPNPMTGALYGRLQRIGQDNPVCREIEPEAPQQLIEFEIAERGPDGTHRLTSDGDCRYVGMESGDWGTPAFHDAVGS
jgi:hypothetical protein